MSKKNKSQDIKFPNGFKFEKTVNGFKVNTTGGEFFPNKNKTIFSTLIFLCILFSILAPCYFAEKGNATFAIGSMLSCFVLIPIIIIIQNLTKIKTEYIFSPNEINIISNKEKISIPKSNIKNIYIKILSSSDSDNPYTYYCIFIDFKEPLHISYKKQNKETVNLFLDNPFKEEKTASFILQELDKILDINDVDNYFEEIEKEKKVIEYREIQLPKDLNYQKTVNGFSVSSVGGIFFPNKYFFPSIIISIILLVVFLLNFENIKNNIMSLENFSIIIKIIITGAIFFGSFITTCGLCYLFIKCTTPKADYRFSSNGISIISKDGVLAIPTDNIESIYIENDVNASLNETSTSHSINIDFKNPIYIKSTNSNIQTASIFQNFSDKKSCEFLVQQMKNALQI